MNAALGSGPHPDGCQRPVNWLLGSREWSGQDGLTRFAREPAGGVR